MMVEIRPLSTDVLTVTDVLYIEYTVCIFSSPDQRLCYYSVVLSSERSEGPIGFIKL